MLLHLRTWLQGDLFPVSLSFLIMLFSFFHILALCLLANATPLSNTKSAVDPESTSPSIASGEVVNPNPAQKATIIVGYPGIGKSYVTIHAKEFTKLKVYDEPGYSKETMEEYKQNLLKLALENIIILSSAHLEVCDSRLLRTYETNDFGA
jgi:hypothetical protein